MKRVIIESPYAGDVDASVAYARACLKDSLKRGEAPIASHLLYTQPGILDDDQTDERALGIDAGHAWIACADLVVVYHDLGVSEGMQVGMRRAFDAGKPVEFRKLNPPPGHSVSHETAPDGSIITTETYAAYGPDGSLASVSISNATVSNYATFTMRDQDKMEELRRG